MQNIERRSANRSLQTEREYGYRLATATVAQSGRRQYLFVREFASVPSSEVFVCLSLCETGSGKNSEINTVYSTLKVLIHGKRSAT